MPGSYPHGSFKKIGISQYFKSYNFWNKENWEKALNFSPPCRILYHFGKLAFVIRCVREKFASLNSFGDPIIYKYFEIRECCCLFPRSFPLCTNPGPTFNTNNPKTDGVFVSFLHSKTIITSSSFVWDIETQSQGISFREISCLPFFLYWNQ